METIRTFIIIKRFARLDSHLSNFDLENGLLATLLLLNLLCLHCNHLHTYFIFIDVPIGGSLKALKVLEKKLGIPLIVSDTRNKL